MLSLYIIGVQRLPLLLGQHEADITFPIVEALPAEQEGARLIGKIPFV